MTRAIRTAAPLLALLVCASPVVAQEQTPPDSAAPAAADSAAARAGPVTPRGALIRSLIVPGWGQAAIGSYLRGGIYFAAQAGSWYMLLKTLARLGEARSIDERRTAQVRAELLALAQQDTARQRLYLEDPEALATDIAEDPRVESIRRLVDARKEQREDWIAQTIFWTFASAVDAYVSAHLADFPAGIAAEPRPDGGMELRVSVPAGGKP